MALDKAKVVGMIKLRDSISLQRCSLAILLTIQLPETAKLAWDRVLMFSHTHTHIGRVVNLSKTLAHLFSVATFFE